MHIFRLIIPTPEARTCCVLYSAPMNLEAFSVAGRNRHHFGLYDVSDVSIFNPFRWLFPKLRWFLHMPVLISSKLNTLGHFCPYLKFLLCTILSPSMLWPENLNHLCHLGSAWACLPTLPGSFQGSNLGQPGSAIGLTLWVSHVSAIIVLWLSDVRCLSLRRLPQQNTLDWVT